VDDKILERLSFDPSVLKLYELLKRHFKDDEFTRNLPLVDTHLPQVQKIHATGDPFADEGKQPAGKEGE
jgi:hypothetical protein